MYGLIDLELARDRRRELLREAEEQRLARSARRPEAEEPGDEGIEVRWGLADDEPAVAEVLELNGMPRWVAFEERFVVAERDGKILGALRYRTESKRLLLGLLVVDPWAGERRTAGALYSEARDLGRELGVSEILACVSWGDYPVAAGYERAGRAWYSSVPRSGDGEDPAETGWRAVFGAWVTIPFRRAFRG